MKLGDVVQITISVTNLDESAVFYETLGYEKITENSLPWPWKQYSDGQNLILLNQDGRQYIGLNYYSADTLQLVKQIEEKGIQFLTKREQDGRLHTVNFSDDDGLMVSLINHDPVEITPPPGEPISKCGKFGEFALGVADFEKASSFWRQFGFEQLHASPDPYPWGIFSDGMIVLGLHQTQEFSGPCMTYFAPDMPQRIKQLEAEDLIVKDGVLAAPGGEQLLLFQGEI